MTTSATITSINQLYKKFSIGLPIELSLDEFKLLLDEFSDYIYDLYFSPPLGIEYHSRTQTHYSFQSDETVKKFEKMLIYAKDKNIKLEYALNTNSLLDEHIYKALTYINQLIDIDSIVTIKRFGPIIKQHFPQKPLIYSYNNDIRTVQDLDTVDKVFDEIVFGNCTLRNFEIFSYAKELGFKVKLLLNNGCSFNCFGCQSGTLACKNFFESNLKKYSAEQLYALQSILPWEFHEYYINSNLIDRFKISSRPSNYDFLKNCLESYIHNNYIHLINFDPKYYYLWCRLGHFPKYYNIFSINRINSYKINIWNNQNRLL